MAEKYSGSFVSKNSLDAEKSNRRSYLEQELEKARSEFESKKKQKELQKQRGETTWMLPSLSKRLKQDEEKLGKSKHKKKKKKHEKKGKKSKKEKKHKKVDLSPESNSSGQSSEDDWVEKADIEEDNGKESFSSGRAIPIEQKTEQDFEPHEKNQREDWMMSGSFLDTVVSSSMSLADKRAKKMEEKKKFMKPTIDELGQHPNELNPYWKNGGSGVPTGLLEKGSESARDHKFGGAGSSWVKKAFERAKEQAEEQGRNLEDVVAERWGSMEKLQALLRNEERRKRRNDDKESRRGWRSKEVRDDSGGQKWRSSEEERTPSFENTSEKHFKDSKQNWKQDKKLKDQPMHGCLKNSDKTEIETLQEEAVRTSEQVSSTFTTERRNHSDSSSESDSDDSEDDARDSPAQLIEPLSEKEINEISAKILRAELLGDQELADKLKAKLEAGRRASSGTTASAKRESKRSKTIAEEEEVVITRTDRHGNVYPLKMSGEEPEQRKKKRKTKAIETHDAKGNRLRYFQEDDVTDLKSMIEEERLTTTEDHQMAVMSRLTTKLGNTVSDHYTLDDMFETSSAQSQSKGVKDEKAKKRAITEQQKAMKKQANCRFCFDHPDVAKHLIISIASHVYLALPITSSLTEGHCLIIPMQHISAATFLDENVIDEVTKFKSSLAKMFREKDHDVIFLETVKNLKYQNHMFIECIPVPIDVGDVAPIYFKKAIEESESEWAQNQKLVDVSKSKGIRSAIPKGLPYFSVEFGMDGGYAHVIEDETLFQNYFGKEIIGGILDLEPMKWRKPPKESFQQHKRKVLKFSESWEPFDWTRDL